MRGSAFRVLFDGLTRTDVSLCIPEVVIGEVMRQFELQLTQSAKNATKALRRAEAITGKKLATELLEERVAGEAAAYGKELRRRISERGIICDYPTVSHADLVARDLSNRKPFAETGKGYRDALIWETVLCLAEKKAEPVAFVSTNHKDFCNEDDDSMHPDLMTDLAKRKIGAEFLLFFHSLDDLIEEWIKPDLEVIDVREQVLAGQYKPFQGDALALQMLTWLEVAGLEPEEIGLSAKFVDPSVSSLQGFEISDVTGAHRLSSGELLISLEVKIDCEFDFFLSKADYYLMDEEEAPHVSDHDWNKHYVAAATTVTLVFIISLTLDAETGEITSLDVDENLTPYSSEI